MLFLVFLVLWRTPRSTVVPYTTLFRSGLRGKLVCGVLRCRRQLGRQPQQDQDRLDVGRLEFRRVCPLNGFYYARLLLQIPDRKSTRLNSSHTVISYAVFCLKKKKTT